MACILVFSISGLHDQFRWNDARWQLLASAQERGVPATSISGGFEIDGWLSYDAYQKLKAEGGCVDGKCACGWYCIDSDYLITMNHLPGFTAISTIQPRYWLASGPSIKLLMSDRLKPEPLPNLRAP